MGPFESYPRRAFLAFTDERIICNELFTKNNHLSKRVKLRTHTRRVVKTRRGGNNNKQTRKPHRPTMVATCSTTTLLRDGRPEVVVAAAVSIQLQIILTIAEMKNFFEQFSI